jgi:hypothetical protein
MEFTLSFSPALSHLGVAPLGCHPVGWVLTHKLLLHNGSVLAEVLGDDVVVAGPGTLFTSASKLDIRHQAHMVRGIHGLPKVSPGPAMSDPSTPCRRATPERALQGWSARKAVGLQPFYTPLDTPRRKGLFDMTGIVIRCYSFCLFVWFCFQASTNF